MKKKNNKKKRKKKGVTSVLITELCQLPPHLQLFLSISPSLFLCQLPPPLSSYHPNSFYLSSHLFFSFFCHPLPLNLWSTLFLSLSLSTIQPPCIRGYMSWQETFFFFLFIFPWMQMAANLPSRARRTYLFICWYAFFSNDLSIVFNCGVLKKSRIFWEGETKILINFWIISICSIQCV